MRGGELGWICWEGRKEMRGGRSEAVCSILCPGHTPVLAEQGRGSKQQVSAQKKVKGSAGRKEKEGNRCRQGSEC